jgi:hypothetical protein
LKESLKKIVFPSNISKITKFILNKETEHRRKERKRSIKKRGRKAPKVSLLKKKGIKYFERRKYFQNFSM